MASKPTSGNSGMASDTKTPATAGLSQTKPKVFDEQGAIGKQFTGESNSNSVVTQIRQSIVSRSARYINIYTNTVRNRTRSTRRRGAKRGWASRQRWGDRKAVHERWRHRRYSAESYGWRKGWHSLICACVCVASFKIPAILHFIILNHQRL